MESNSDPTATNYQQVTVDVPEDRIAQFHVFFARFLATSGGPGRWGRPGRRHGGAHRRGCAKRHEAAEHGEAEGQAASITEV